MNLRRRIERIERQAHALADGEAEDRRIVSIVGTLLKTPVEELGPADPRLAHNALIAYYAWTLAELHFAQERPEFYSDANLEEWRARKRHAESLVAATEREDKTGAIGPVVDGVRRVFVAALRDRDAGAQKDGGLPRESKAAVRA